MAADDVVTAVGRVAVGPPLDGSVEIGGPEALPFDGFIARGLGARDDPRHVVADRHARYFGARLEERSLLPGEGAELADTRFDDWIARRS